MIRTCTQALEPVWKLNASIDILDQLENNSMASMPCLGLSANDWTHFVHQSLDRQVSVGFNPA